MTPSSFVGQLNSNAGNVLSAAERTAAINLFGGAGDGANVTATGQAVRQVAEDSDLANAEFNRAFVLMQYFGYLRRNPNDAPDGDYTGYDFLADQTESVQQQLHQRRDGQGIPLFDRVSPAVWTALIALSFESKSAKDFAHVLTRRVNLP